MQRRWRVLSPNRCKRTKGAPPQAPTMHRAELLPGGDRMELSLEELEEKRQEGIVKMQQCWQGRSWERMTGEPAGEAVTRGMQRRWIHENTNRSECWLSTEIWQHLLSKRLEKYAYVFIFIIICGNNLTGVKEKWIFTVTIVFIMTNVLMGILGSHTFFSSLTVPVTCLRWF